MKRSYSQCILHIASFIHGEDVPWPPDVFTLCRFTGVRNFKRFIRTNLAQVPVTTEESVDEYFLQYHREREVPFTEWSIPPDEVIGKMCEAVVEEEPPSVEVGARLFIDYYGVEPVHVKYFNLDCLSLYDVRDGTIYVNPGKAQDEVEVLEGLVVGLFDHLCQKKLWRFDDDPEVSLVKQNDEREGFVWAFMERCFDLGLVE